MTYECKSDVLRRLGAYKDYAPTILRVFAGFFFMMHGVGKFWGPNAGIGPGLEGWLGWMASMGVPAFFAYAAAVVELVGGFMLIIGLWVRYWSVLGIIVMVTAIFLTKIGEGLFSAELDLLFIGVFLSLLFTGPGRLSVEGCVAKKMSKKNS